VKNLRYRSVFKNQIIRAAFNAEADKYLSKASLEDLKNIGLPNDLNLLSNPDLIVDIYNGAVINRMNRNDDGIATDTAMAIKGNFIHKPTNIEHKKKRTVGHIVSVGWSTFGGNELIEHDVASKMDSPFNLVISSVVYRANEDKFSDALIDSTDETNHMFNSISASWEIAFDEYNIVLGSKNVNEAEIVSDPKQIIELSKYLKSQEGKGETPDGVYVGRLIIGDATSVLPIGFGFTSNPAAEVEGVVLRDFTDELEEEGGATEEEKDNSYSENLRLIAASEKEKEANISDLLGLYKLLKPKRK